MDCELLNNVNIKTAKKHELLDILKVAHLCTREQSKKLIKVYTRVSTEMSLDAMLDHILHTEAVYELYTFLRGINIEILNESFRVKLLVVMYNSYNILKGKKAKIVANCIDYIQKTFIRDYSEYSVPSLCDVPLSKFNLSRSVNETVKTEIVKSSIFIFYPEVLNTGDFDKYLMNIDIPIHYTDTNIIKDNKYKSFMDFYPDYNNFVKNSEWVNSCKQWHSKLSLRDKMTVYGYIRTGSTICSTVSLSGRTEDLLKEIYNVLKLNLEYFYLPFYFQLCDILEDQGMLTETFETEELKYTTVCKQVRGINPNVLVSAALKWKEEFDNLFNTCPKTVFDMYVYRGERTMYAKEGEYFAKNYHSTSVSPSVPAMYLEKVFKRIRVPKGTCALFLQNISYYPILEVVLPQNSKYIIKSSRDIVFYVNAINHQQDINNKYKLCTPLKMVKFIEVELQL